MAATFVVILGNVTDCHRCHELTRMLARIGKVEDVAYCAGTGYANFSEIHHHFTF